MEPIIVRRRVSLKLILAIVLLLFYFVVRYGFEHWLDGFGLYGSMGFEAIFCLLTVICFWQEITWRATPKRSFLFELIAALVGGFVVYKLAGRLNAPVPFDLRSNLVLIMLLVIAPVLEESIYRLAIWQSAYQITKDKGLTVAVSALAFSWGHFHAFFFVPEEIKPFVLYQTCYTFLLGLWWGFARARYRTVFVGMAFHLLFNLGFYLASRI